MFLKVVAVVSDVLHVRICTVSVLMNALYRSLEKQHNQFGPTRVARRVTGSSEEATEKQKEEKCVEIADLNL